MDIKTAFFLSYFFVIGSSQMSCYFGNAKEWSLTKPHGCHEARQVCKLVVLYKQNEVSGACTTAEHCKQVAGGVNSCTESPTDLTCCCNTGRLCNNTRNRTRGATAKGDSKHSRDDDKDSNGSGRQVEMSTVFLIGLLLATSFATI